MRSDAGKNFDKYVDEIVPDSLQGSRKPNAPGSGMSVDSLDPVSYDNIQDNVVRKDIRLLTKLWADDDHDSQVTPHLEDDKEKGAFTKVLSKFQKKKLRRNKRTVANKEHNTPDQGRSSSHWSMKSLGLLLINFLLLSGMASI